MFVILKGVTFPRQQQFHIFVMKCPFWLQALIMIAVNTLMIIVLLSFPFDLHPFHVFISLKYSYLYSNLLLLLYRTFLFLVILSFLFFSLFFFYFFVFPFLSSLFLSFPCFSFISLSFLSYRYFSFPCFSFISLSFLSYRHLSFPFRVILSFH